MRETFWLVTVRSKAMRARILEWIGIPTGIGIGPTKTLAKLANYVAKSADRKPGSYPAKLARIFWLVKYIEPEIFTRKGISYAQVMLIYGQDLSN